MISECQVRVTALTFEQIPRWNYVLDAVTALEMTVRCVIIRWTAGHEVLVQNDHKQKIVIKRTESWQARQC